MQPAIPVDLVRHALDAVCSSTSFARSPRHQHLLRYLVEELLAGRLANLREIHLGVHVFGRNAANFDPRTDTIVRVEARRLRTRLTRYYQSEGAGQRVVIELPLGGYVPTLAWLAAAPMHRDTSTTLPVVAVLPFDALDHSDDVNVVDWCDALTEEITDTLARLPQIRVVARTSAMRFKGARRDIREIAKLLAADVLIEGSLQHEGNQLRAIAQLITANDGLHLWSDSVTGQASSRFRFFDTVSAMITNAIPLAVAELRDGSHTQRAPTEPAEPAEPAASATRARHPDARELEANGTVPDSVRDTYERGRMAARVRTIASYARATKLFAEVTIVAPQFARGHAALAAALLSEVGMTMRSATDAVAAIKSAVASALALDPKLAEAHATLGMLHLYYEHDWPSAERSLLRAVSFGPSLVSAYRSYAFGLMFMRRFDEAERVFIEARALDPLDPQTRIHQGLLTFYRRDYSAAIEVFSDLLDTNESDVLARTLLAASSLHSGDLERAEKLYRDANLLHPELSIGLCGFAVTAAYKGDVDVARAIRCSLQRFAEKSFVSPYQFAMVDCALGEHQRALAGLERAALAHDYNFLCSAVDPTFDRLHGTPEWISLMRRFGMPHE